MSDDLIERLKAATEGTTPGPWSFGRTGDEQRMILGGSSGNYVANVQIYQTPRHMGQWQEPEREANARFIAAARELVPAMRDRIEADAKRIAELARERDNWSETALMHLNAEQTFLSWLREAGEHMRSEGVTICDDGTESGEVLSAKVPMCAALLKSRADAAEARIAELEGANAKQHEALLCARALIDTPIARRKLNLDPHDERITIIRAALEGEKADE